MKNSADNPLILLRDLQSKRNSAKGAQPCSDDGLTKVKLQDIIVFDVSTPVRSILRASEQIANWFASFEWHMTIKRGGIATNREINSWSRQSPPQVQGALSF